MSIKITDPEEDRYHRLRLIRWWDQEKLSKSSALVLGAGALGNEVVKNLALLGLGKVWILDFDRIETSNLTRSALFRQKDVGRYKAEILAERASEMNPDCKFVPLIRDARYDLGLAFLSGINLFFGCLDNREARYFVNRYAYLLQKPFVDGGLDTLNGSVTLFFPPATACYECTLEETDRLELQKRISCLKSVAPEIKHHVPTAPTVASLIGALQVQIGVRYLHQLNVPAGRRLGLYGLSDVFFDIKLEISETCGLHAAADPLPAIELLPVSENDSLRTVLGAAKSAWNADELIWDFDRDLISGLQCSHCGKISDFTGTQSLYEGESICECQGTFKPQIVSSYSGVEPWGERSFPELGFPREHIHCAVASGNRVFFRMIA